MIKTYWAGFSDGRLAVDTRESGNGDVLMPELYLTRREARSFYQDVRKVEVVEIKKTRKPKTIRGDHYA